MAGFQSPIPIYQAIQNIENKDYLLPAFQREFVWTAEQIEQLFDSLMQGYPISSMLFWKVRDSTRTDFNFYRFLTSYVQKFKTHNELHNNITKDFYAILDGQQRLTALYIGLCGSYAYHEYYHSWDNNPQSFPERTLYLCITKQNTSEDSDRKYLFYFEKTSITNNKDLYVDDEGETWFKVGRILSLHNNTNDCDIDDFCDNNTISRDSKKILRTLERAIFDAPNINYYEEDDQNPDKAVNIFTRINSGGTYLSFSDIMFSLMVANWTIDARTEITQLVDRMNEKGFSINIDYVLKAFLFLYHKTIKFSINSFSKNFCKLLEDNWIDIRDSIDSLFDLLRSFGLDNYTLTSNNATLPILYYIYHRKLFKDFTNKIEYENDRKLIKKWLFSSLLRQEFGSHSDATLAKARKAFTDDFEKDYINISIKNFPIDKISENLKRSEITDDVIDELLNTQKDNKYCFTILAMLYPNLDYKNNNFHKDHLHPDDRYKELSEELRQKYTYSMYNSIVNLQMLDANENESKGKKMLDEWVSEELQKTNNRKQFFDAHLIPDIDLSHSNFDVFYQERKAMLSKILKELL